MKVDHFHLALFFYILHQSKVIGVAENGFQVANSNHTELSALCQGWLRSQGGQEGPSEALMVAIQVAKVFVHLYI